MQTQARLCISAAFGLLVLVCGVRGPGGSAPGPRVARADIEVGMMAGGKFYSADSALSREGFEDQPQSALNHSGLFGLRLGFLPIPRLAVEAEVGVSPTGMQGNLRFPSGTEIAGAQVAVIALRGHLLVNLLTGRVRPFLLLGGGGHLSAPLSPGIVRADAEGTIHAGAGLAFDIRPGWGIRFDGRFLLSQSVNAVTPEGEVLAAVFGRFGSAPPPPPPPPGPPPVLDSDSDGVLDSVDRCPQQAGPPANLGCPAPVVQPVPAPAPTPVPAPAPAQNSGATPAPSAGTAPAQNSGTAPAQNSGAAPAQSPVQSPPPKQESPPPAQSGAR